MTAPCRRRRPTKIFREWREPGYPLYNMTSLAFSDWFSYLNSAKLDPALGDWLDAVQLNSLIKAPGSSQVAGALSGVVNATTDEVSNTV